MGESGHHKNLPRKFKELFDIIGIINTVMENKDEDN